MAKKLYVGNLTYDTTEDNLVELFSEYGEVLSAQIIIDRDTNRSKGFGFVEMGRRRRRGGQRPERPGFPGP